MDHTQPVGQQGRQQRREFGGISRGTIKQLSNQPPIRSQGGRTRGSDLPSHILESPFASPARKRNVRRVIFSVKCCHHNFSHACLDSWTRARCEPKSPRQVPSVEVALREVKSKSEKFTYYIRAGRTGLE